MKEQDLTLVGLTEDKQKLVLVNQAGEEFTLPADARLRAALRGEHARLGQLEITMESALRPRDIQARIRAGESPEAVAAAAQTTIEKIMGYATQYDSGPRGATGIEFVSTGLLLFGLSKADAQRRASKRRRSVPDQRRRLPAPVQPTDRRKTLAIAAREDRAGVQNLHPHLESLLGGG